jgi:hypothetical protein
MLRQRERASSVARRITRLSERSLASCSCPAGFEAPTESLPSQP